MALASSGCVRSCRTGKKADLRVTLSFNGTRGPVPQCRLSGMTVGPDGPGLAARFSERLASSGRLVSSSPVYPLSKELGAHGSAEPQQAPSEAGAMAPSLLYD